MVRGTRRGRAEPAHARRCVVIVEAIRSQPFTCAIVALYASNICWQLWSRAWGQVLHWSAARLITISATWLMGWKGGAS